MIVPSYRKRINPSLRPYIIILCSYDAGSGQFVLVSRYNNDFVMIDDSLTRHYDVKLTNFFFIDSNVLDKILLIFPLYGGGEGDRDDNYCYYSKG